VVDRDEARAAKVKDNRVRISARAGRYLLRLGPQSVVAWKLWAGHELIPKDVKRLLDKKQASAKLLKVFCDYANPSVRSEAVRGLRRLKRDPQASETAAAFLGDSEAAVRCEALDVCMALGHPSLADQAMEMLADPHVKVRRQAAACLAKCRAPEAVEALNKAISVEADAGPRKALQRALKTCGGGTYNPYTNL